MAVVLIHIWLKKAALDTVPVDPDVVVAANNVSFDELLSDFIVIFSPWGFHYKKHLIFLVNIKLGTNSGSLNIPSIDRIVAFKVAFKCLISDCFGNKINSFFHACVLGHTFGKSEKLEICKHFN